MQNEAKEGKSQRQNPQSITREASNKDDDSFTYTVLIYVNS